MRPLLITDYPVTQFDGSKSFIISTTSILGGKNPFLGWAYISVGSICFLLGIVLLIVHLKYRRYARSLALLNHSATNDLLLNVSLRFLLVMLSLRHPTPTREAHTHKQTHFIRIGENEEIEQLTFSTFYNSTAVVPKNAFCFTHIVDAKKSIFLIKLKFFPAAEKRRKVLFVTNFYLSKKVLSHMF
jgi:hypothetical protein